MFFVNLKVFTDLRWGTLDLVAFRDAELGLVRLRAHGVFNIRIVQPVLLINTLAGTMGRYTTGEVEDYLRQVIVSRFNDYLGEHLRSLLDLPGRFDDIAAGLKRALEADFARFGLALDGLYVTSITPPEEVQQAIDDRSRLSVIKDMDNFVRMKAAMAMEKAATGTGEAGAGLGLGLGMMMPALFGNRRAGAAGRRAWPRSRPTATAGGETCPFCGRAVGQPSATTAPPICRPRRPSATCVPGGRTPARGRLSRCQPTNLPGAVCNQCGDRLG